MAECVLCQKREADKIGSHIVPAFMLTSLVGRRNKEIAFEISSQGYVKKYFGREVSADAIHALLDRELTEDDLAENENLFAMDNLVCTECEDRLGVLESLAAIEIKTIKEGGPPDIKNDASMNYFESEANLLLRCLFYSIAFRISAAEKFDYDLNPSLGERMRSLLDRVLSTDAEVFQQNLKKNRHEIIEIPFAIFFAPLGDEDGANQIYSHRQTSIPSFIIVNEFIICSYNKKSQVDFDFGTVFGITRNEVREAINFKESVLRIAVMASRKKLNDALTATVARRTLQNLGNMYFQAYVRIKGANPSNEQVAAFVTEMATDETNLSDRLTPRFMAGIMMKHLSAE